MLVFALAGVSHSTPVFAQEAIQLSDPLKTQTLNIIGSVEIKTETIYAYTSTILIPEQNEIIAERSENKKVFDIGNGKKEYHIYAGVPQFYNDGTNWYQVEYGKTTTSFFKTKQTAPLGWFSALIQTTLAQTSYYPGLDGEIRINTSGASYATERARTNGDSVDYTGASIPLIGEYVAGVYQMTRLAFLFDTSAIPDTDTIDSATMTVSYNSSGGNNQTEATYPANLSLVSASPAGTSSLVVGDFDLFGSTKYGTDVTLASFVSGGTGAFTLNASGLANISKTGNTGLGIRPSNDFSDSTAPTARSYAYMYHSEQTGTANDPVLVVTTSASGGGGGGSSATSTPEEIMAITQFSSMAFAIFFLSLISTVWIWTRYI